MEETDSFIPIWSGRGIVADVPDACEVEWQTHVGEIGNEIRPLDEAFVVPSGSTIRWRFRWHGRPGAWSTDLQPTAYPPTDSDG